MPSLTRVEFTESVLLHEFDDGWKVFDLQSDADIDQLGKTYHNCWQATGFSYWGKKILPCPEEELEPLRQKHIESWDKPELRERHGDAWVEKHIAKAAQINRTADRTYKLIALVDAEGNLRAGGSLGLREVLSTILYGRCDSLKQQEKSWIVLDGFEFCFLEGRTTESYNLEGESGQRIADWWKGICEGEWQEETWATCQASAEARKARVYA